MNEIAELKIADENNATLFSDDSIRYVVPLYQRAYAWKEQEITQLIDDICDCGEDNYFLGSLIVDKKGTSYEVVDGQQRLTTLFLLLKVLNQCLGEQRYDVKNILRFECREVSNYSLDKFDDLENEDIFESTILEGKIILLKKLKEENNLDKVVTGLIKLKLYRIEVPLNTDLNRYFEIMNTRGEQLEQHDILKAKLISFIPYEYRNAFARIWEACSDMTGYVQMHFPKEMRESLFASGWNTLPQKGFLNRVALSHNCGEGSQNSIKQILQKSVNEIILPDSSEADNHVRFESIIDFPYFLLHALRVYVKEKKVTALGNGELYGKLLDDKKLLSDFESVIESGYINGEKISTEAFSLEFIEELLRARFIFDSYIIKREYTSAGSEGEWSLKTLCTSGQRSQKKPYYSNTSFQDKYEQKNRQSRIIMLQACYRVSYTSPKVMHWITDALMLAKRDDLSWCEYEIQLENIAKEAVRKDFLVGEKFEMGVDTPHIVFNYLDYLLWLSNRSKYKDFVFEFRNSVEHWYPQNPSRDTFGYWGQDEGVNRFGNLCLIQRNVNSRFSNMSPEAKKSTFKVMIEKGSLKLRIMSDLTTSDVEWREGAFAAHEDEMIRLLKYACEGLR